MKNAKTTAAGILAAVGVLSLAAAKYLGASPGGVLESLSYILTAVGVGGIGVAAADPTPDA